MDRLVPILERRLTYWVKHPKTSGSGLALLGSGVGAIIAAPAAVLAPPAENPLVLIVTGLGLLFASDDDAGQTVER
jgi:hypothetical protein